MAPSLSALNLRCCSRMQFLVEYMQLLAILQLAITSHPWSPATSWVYTIMGLPLLSTAGWLSIDCMLPAGSSVSQVALARLLIPAVLVPGQSVAGAAAGAA